MFGLLLELIIFDINIWVIAKGTQTTRPAVKQSKPILAKIFSHGIKKTYLHYSVLVVNTIVFLLRMGLTINQYVESRGGIQAAISNIVPWIYENITSNRVWLFAILGETLIAMFMVYRAVGVFDNRSLSVTELDQEYLKFSSPESIDARSDLLLIAGDLSFLGAFPKKDNLSPDWRKNARHTLERTLNCAGVVKRTAR